MSDEPAPVDNASEPKPRLRPGFWIVVVAAIAVVAGLVGRSLAPAPTLIQQPATPARPIVQIVRQPSFPSLAEAIDRLCPSIATIGSGTPAFAVSADGWLMASGPLTDSSNLSAVFGDGRKAMIDEVRTDPVSGLVVAHSSATGLGPLSFADQSFARIGDFGFSLATAHGSGCSAQSSMIGSDFLVDGLAQGIYLRLQQGAVSLAPGSAFLGADGSVLGVATSAGNDAILPAPLASVIANELIRNSPSPIASFGFRAVDFTPELATRLGDVRARGAGVAIVQPKSVADKAGLRAGDVVIAVDQSPVASASELSRALDAVVTSAALAVARGDAQLTLTVSRTISRTRG